MALADQQYQEIGYLLVVEGWEIGFTNREELAGGALAWIDDYSEKGATGRRIVTGLEMPDKITLEIGILESGLPINDGATFGVVDREGVLITFMQDIGDGEAVSQRLSPLDDPAPSDLVGFDTTVPLHGRQIDGEQIGPSGERRMFQVLPNGSLPGYDHAAIQAQSQTLRISAVQDLPRWLEGRLCALYIVRRDPFTGAWESWESLAPIWWGTMREATSESFVWSFECDGPSSWLRRTINANRVADWRDLQTLLDLKTDPGQVENQVAICLRYLPHDDWEGGQVRCYRQSYLTVPSGLYDAASLAATIDALVQTGTVTAGPDDTFATQTQLGQVSFGADAVRISCLEDPLADRGACLHVRMHEKVWLRMGWDIEEQGRKSWDLISTEFELYSNPKATGMWDVGYGWTPDGAPTGYRDGWFATLPIGQDWNSEGIPNLWNGEAQRIYQPLYAGGVDLLDPEGGQRVVFGFSTEAAYNEGQTARPPAHVTLGSGDCDTTGFIAVRGKYRTSLEEDGETAYQIAKLSWHDSGDTSVGPDLIDSYCVAYIEQWLDPRMFGAGNDKLDRAWASNTLQYCPIAVLGYNLNAPDLAHVVLLRLLLSTGTAPWSAGSYEGEPGASQPAGANAHPDAASPYLAADDREIADLGLGIPASLIDWGSFVDAAHGLPAGAGGALAKTRIGLIGPADSQELLQRILEPRGWCFSLRGGRYGLFSRGAALSIDEAEVSLTEADIAADPDATPPFETVSFRPLEPIDIVEVEYGANQLGEGDTQTFKVQARDPRAHLRRGNASVTIDGRTLLPDGSWTGEFSSLWGDQLARWYAEPLALVRVDVKGNAGAALWPGTVVRYTSPWPASRDGAYGMTGRVGRVVKTELNTQTLTKTLEILIQAGDPKSRRRFAPIARLVDGVPTVEDRHNVGTGELTCYPDAWGAGDGGSDVEGFDEPAWLGVGGVARCLLWQSYDGVTWENTASFEALEANTEKHTITYTNLSGDIWERMFAVVTLAPYDDQFAGGWPCAIYGVTCNPDGTFGGVPTLGFKWGDV